MTGASTLTGNVTAAGTLSVTGLATFLGGATTTALTLLNGSTIDNATATQINLAGASELTAARVGLIRAGFNGYTGELGGSGYNPVTLTTSTGNRAGAELYYGYTGTSGDMRGMRVFIDDQAPTGNTLAGTLSGADIEVRGNSVDATGSTLAVARGLLAGVLSKNDTITNAIGVLSDLDTGGNGSVGTWKGFAVTHSDNQQAVTQGYGLYIDSNANTNVTNWTDLRLSSGAGIMTGAASPNGSVTAPKGSLYVETNTPALWQNTDAGTTWSTGAVLAKPYGMFYGTTVGTGNEGSGSGDYAATVAAGAPVPFPRNGANSGSGIARTFNPYNESFTLPNTGTYEVTFNVSTTEPGQLQLAFRVDTTYTPIAHTTAVGAGGTNGGPIGGTFFITATAGQALAVINPAGNPAALTITPAGTLTYANVPTLTIKQL